MTSYRPTKWVSWLSLAEWWFNSTYHSSLKLTSFQALYGYNPQQFGLFSHNPSSNGTVTIFRKGKQWENFSSTQEEFEVIYKIFGPYQILARLGKVAYKIKLPTNCKIHPVFHVSQLKPKLGAGLLTQTTLPSLDSNGSMKVTPFKVLATKTVKKHQQLVEQILVNWTHSSEADATWEDNSVIKKQFPKFILEDKNQIE
ncbi:uncharacterized protein LOC113315733 [Papaver somniferum]|uniref:uncharacterized protein LOC113315733 n=1 Tax=Papaver somniferum TaxID=3469 RepID=UPI000E6FB55B|nr:uncharacterized protein LOC113315733 [Papaver somniferum]